MLFNINSRHTLSFSHCTDENNQNLFSMMENPKFTKFTNTTCHNIKQIARM